MEDARTPSKENRRAGDEFLGKALCSLDEKNRLTIPVKFRKLIREDAAGGRHLVICRAKDHRTDCLALYTLEYFNDIMDRLRALDPGPEKRRLIRFYSNESEQLRIDRYGRVQIPSEFLEVLGNARDLIVSGESDYLEIWKRETFDSVREEGLEGFYGGTFEP